MASNDYVGKAVYKIQIDTSDLKASLKDISKNISSIEKVVSKTGDNATKEAGKLSKTWVATTAIISTAASKAFSAVSGAITQSLDSAISRVDVLNNFPAVMKSLGYSSEDASKSINQISESLDGLPTSLDSMAGNVQKLAATMGNLSDGTVNATSVSIAFNNMMLSGGKGTEAAANAFEQYNQMLAVGKVDQQAWNSVVNAAPGQMKQLAETLLGAGAASQDLYNAMKNGNITFDQFNEAIVRLNEEGGEGFASFNEQARAATDGIGTAMENVQNRVNKAVGSVIEAVGQSNISGAINSFSSQFGKLGDAVAAAITGEGNPQQLVQEFVNGIEEAITTVLPQIGELAGQILPVILEAIVGILPALLEGIIQCAVSLVTSLAEAMPELLTTVIDAIVNLFYVLLEPDNFNAILNAFIQVLMAIVEAIPRIVEALATAIPTLINAIVNLLTNGDALMALINGAITLLFAIIDAIPVIIQALATALPAIIESIINFLTSPDTIAMLIEAAITLFLALVVAVPQILGALLGAFGTLVGSLWEGITRMFGVFAENFGGFLGGIFKGALNGVLGFIENFLNSPIKLINGFLDIINGAFGWLGINIGRIDLIGLPRMYTGGIVPAVSGGMPIIAGDGGEDEWVVPESKMASLIEQLESRGNSGGETYNIYVDGVFATSAQERRKVADDIVAAIEENKKRRFALA